MICLKYQEILNNKEINAYLKKGDANLGLIGPLHTGFTQSWKNTGEAGIFQT